jgi:hypothetical protein
MSLDPSETFIISVEFDDGSVVKLGGGDELFVTPGENTESVLLNDFRLELIRALQKVNSGDV